MDRHADHELGLGPKALLRVQRGSHRLTRPREHGEGGVALPPRLEQPSTGGLHRLGHEEVVVGQLDGHGGGICLPPCGRPDDVGQQEGDHPCGQGGVELMAKAGK